MTANKGFGDLLEVRRKHKISEREEGANAREEPYALPVVRDFASAWVQVRNGLMNYSGRDLDGDPLEWHPAVGDCLKFKNTRVILADDGEKNGVPSGCVAVFTFPQNNVSSSLTSASRHRIWKLKPRKHGSQFFWFVDQIGCYVSSSHLTALIVKNLIELSDKHEEARG